VDTRAVPFQQFTVSGKMGFCHGVLGYALPTGRPAY